MVNDDLSTLSKSHIAQDLVQNLDFNEKRAFLDVSFILVDDSPLSMLTDTYCTGL